MDHALHSPKLFHVQIAASMSLYFEAAAILANEDKIGGSLKSRIFKKKDLKSSPGQLFAIIAESSKWSPVLKDVIEKTGLLAEERKVRIILQQNDRLRLVGLVVVVVLSSARKIDIVTAHTYSCTSPHT